MWHADPAPHSSLISWTICCKMPQLLHFNQLTSDVALGAAQLEGCTHVLG